MARLAADAPEVRRIDAALAEWRQGDLALDEHWFIHAADPALALTAASGQADDGLQPTTSEVEGLVVVTQTCDIVRSCFDRPFVEVVPLVQVAPAVHQEVERCRRPAYAVVPAVSGRHLVADLDRVMTIEMTIEKSVVASWTRTPGWTTDQQARALAQAPGRKRARLAFPDDFSRLAGGLQRRLREKHDRQSDDGRALRALREIRVRAAPSWDADRITLTLWFVRGTESPDFGDAVPSHRPVDDPTTFNRNSPSPGVALHITSSGMGLLYRRRAPFPRSSFGSSQTSPSKLAVSMTLPSPLHDTYLPHLTPSTRRTSDAFLPFGWYSVSFPWSFAFRWPPTSQIFPSCEIDTAGP